MLKLLLQMVNLHKSPDHLYTESCLPCEHYQYVGCLIHGSPDCVTLHYGQPHWHTGDLKNNNTSIT